MPEVSSGSDCPEHIRIVGSIDQKVLQNSRISRADVLSSRAEGSLFLKRGLKRSDVED
jgi:hypothetical protein